MKRLSVEDLPVSAYMTTDLATVSPDDDLATVLGKMKAHDVHELPVLLKKNLVGVVTMRDIMRRKGVPPTTKVSTLMKAVAALDPDDPLPVAAERLISAGFRALPVVKGRKLVGILSRTDLVRALAEIETLKGLLVRDFMTPNPLAVAEDDQVDVAVKAMQSLGERSIPVVDRNRRLKGVLGMKDVADLFARPKSSIREHQFVTDKDKISIEVKGLMRYPPVTVGPDADVHRAAELMIQHNISSVIVVEDDKPVGILTKADLMHLLAGFRERGRLFVELSGLEDEPSDTYDGMYDLIQKEMRRIAQITTPKTLTIHVQKYKPEGDRWKYSLRSRFATAHRMYYSNHFDWDLRIALSGLLDTLYKRIVKEKERKVTARRRRPST